MTNEINNQQSEINNPKPLRLLVVDDDKQIRRMLNRMLARDGYAVTLASDGTQARKCLEKQAFDLVLCDVNMPGKFAIHLSRHIATRYADTAIIHITSVDNPNVADSAIEAGTYGYIIKPFNPNEVMINIRNALRRRNLEIANRNYRQNLEQMVEERTVRLRKSMEGIIRAMRLTVESRDLYTSGHQQRVARIATAMAQEMKLSRKQRQGIYLGGMIHDLGKISVPAELLSKPTRLSDTEFSLIKSHARVSYDILKEIEFPWPIADMMHQHHERMDGSGYPQELSGEEILPEARILCIADVVEAMASHRPYRPALGIDTALEEISDNAGKRYDPDAANACLRLFREKGFAFDQ